MEFETRIAIRVFLFLLPFFIIVGRLIYITPSTNSPPIATSEFLQTHGSLMIFLGSGGHTGEMLKILSNVDVSNVTRTWIVSSNDTTSLLKCEEFERSVESPHSPRFLTLHRARSVGEPLISSAKNTVISFYDTFRQIYSLPELPSVLLINGPGTSVPIAYILFVFKFLGLGRTSIVYVESLARVNELSLSGKLVLPVADRFIVQWKPLSLKYKRAEYHGILV
ncbi:UDP-N-acetylglucosamine transferase subunit Alg14p [[Candida] jaroonii]|uniref:UDP-N-acetylglucosamine transferase subunit Alg14p n=1 Tax=[Candida] jaroonii TaxID=467808 RepID=A0ACA9YFS2_9ASCO|nr:UDP-N-acetylglucosamine transferase subunit Alg14p [[Candida] jaroonii]